MLKQKKVNAEIKKLFSTVLEPSAGEGIFLVEIVKIKLKSAANLSEKSEDFDYKSLIALSSLYGIELLADNFNILKHNVLSAFNETYIKLKKEYWNKNPDYDVLKSAKTIIDANMVHGNTLTCKDSGGGPIIFSEWKVNCNDFHKVTRSEFIFDSVINGDTNLQSFQQLDLFSNDVESKVEIGRAHV